MSGPERQVDVTGPDWSTAELAEVDATDELHVAVRGEDGSLRAGVPIWTVAAGGQVYVRTWHRRDTGWFGHALRTRRARITVGSLVADVLVTDVGAVDADVRAAVDAAYAGKYGRYGGATVARMVGDEAAVTTLRLDRVPPA